MDKCHSRVIILLHIIFSPDAFATLRTRKVSPIRWGAAISSIFIGVILVMVSTILYAKQEHVRQYGVVIDAGSGHTSQILFTWDPEESVSVST